MSRWFSWGTVPLDLSNPIVVGYAAHDGKESPDERGFLFGVSQKGLLQPDEPAERSSVLAQVSAIRRKPVHCAGSPSAALRLPPVRRSPFATNAPVIHRSPIRTMPIRRQLCTAVRRCAPPSAKAPLQQTPVCYEHPFAANASLLQSPSCSSRLIQRTALCNAAGIYSKNCFPFVY